VISVDGTWIKTQYAGVILTVCVMDGNHKLFPIGVGIFDIENTSSWSKFFEAMGRAHPRLLLPTASTKYTMIHDRQKGLIKSHDQQLPYVNQAHCVQHIQSNLKARGDRNIADLVYSVAKATSAEAYQIALNRCQDADPTADLDGYNYLLGTHPEKWARVLFPVRRFGVVNSNSSEAFNSSICDARTLTHLRFLEDWVDNLATDVAGRKSIHETEAKATRIFSAWLLQRLEKSKSRGEGWSVSPTANKPLSAAVKETGSTRRTCMVDLRADCTTPCSCGYYEEYLYPCAHMYAFFCYQRARGVVIDLHVFTSPIYSISTLVRLYDFVIERVDIATLVPDPTVLPPPALEKKPGPLPTKRRERGDGSKLAKRSTTNPAGRQPVPQPAQPTETTEPATDPLGWFTPMHSHTLQSSHNASTALPVSSTNAASFATAEVEATPRAKRPRQATVCSYCNWNHYFGVTMCPRPLKPTNPAEVPAAQAARVTPATLICATCGWVHDKDHTPCRQPWKAQ